MCEVMNVKVLPADVKNLILEEGIYECYHMNKKNWVSIILDDTLEKGLAKMPLFFCQRKFYTNESAHTG